MWKCAEGEDHHYYSTEARMGISSNFADSSRRSALRYLLDRTFVLIYTSKEVDLRISAIIRLLARWSVRALSVLSTAVAGAILILIGVLFAKHHEYIVLCFVSANFVLLSLYFTHSHLIFREIRQRTSFFYCLPKMLLFDSHLKSSSMES